MGWQGGFIVYGENHLFRRPLDKVSALLPADLALAVEEVPVVRVLAVGDPLFDGFVLDDALEVMVAIGRVGVDLGPLQAVGRGEDGGHRALALGAGAVVGVVDQ